jgi:hypothetical protein
MKPQNSEWERLTKAARHVSAPEVDSTVPHAFAARVVALAADRRDEGLVNAWARVSLRAMLVAFLVMIAAVAANVRPIMTALDEDAASLAEQLPETGDTAA